ncbi:hypothetical protein [Usitatibacter rugosus]|uniref:hypothetical protein n=1 Tax=Usitatibacter rugosus TaxID=2732067 RepID=UPI001487FD94|nr:hypothetical protein [Usitatibacter rugosus]
MLRTIATTFALTVVANAACAGGTSWPVKVASVARGAHETAVVVLVPGDDPEAPWSKCERVTIRVLFDREGWFVHTFKSDPSLLSKHREALLRLESAAKESVGVRFGQIGSGLKRSESASCEFFSKGFELLEESDGQKHVYSFFEPTS